MTQFVLVCSDDISLSGFQDISSVCSSVPLDEFNNTFFNTRLDDLISILSDFNSIDPVIVGLTVTGYMVIFISGVTTSNVIRLFRRT